MTKQLRKRIMLTMMLLLSLTYIAILVAINIWSYANTRSDADNVLRFLLQQKGQPRELPPDSQSDRDETPPAPPDTSEDSADSNKHQPMDILASHYILARFNKDGSLESIENLLSDNYSDEDIQNYCNEILKKKENHGAIGQLRYMVQQTENSTEIFFIDHTLENRNSERLFIITIIIGAIGLIVFAILSYVISGLMVRPVEETFEKQKQFVSDASHELKTPITVILSNSELLEDQIGDNQWLSYIKKECDRMRNLVESLLTLTRLEQSPYQTECKSEFSISDAMLERILPLESIAFEKNIKMEYSIEPNLSFCGVKEQIQQILTILIDNALNHTHPNGTVSIELKKTSHHIRLIVENTGDPIPEEDRDKLFERFYRVDKARNRVQGHYGLGLSIAKTITQNHHGKISVQCDNGITSFIVSFPSRN